MESFVPSVPVPVNEPVLSYAPETGETKRLKAELKRLSSESIEIPLIINGKEVRTGQTETCIIPHNHQHQLATFHKAGRKEIADAIEGAERARADWARLSWRDRAAVFLKAGDLLATTHRMRLNAATMLGQSKTCHQAEIDSACELVDFFRFNVHFQRQLLGMQPNSSPGIWNQMEYRALEGFVFAVTPFNFTSIAGNLPTAPALMGNTVLWKPASTSVYSGYFIMKLLEEAGLPSGVIQFIPGSGATVGDTVLASPHLGGIHFTGSTGVFQQMWKQVGEDIATYRSYPRIVGETGGKDFVFAHASAEVEGLVTALIRGAFEYQGQKCSAASRAYIPKSLWPQVKSRLIDQVKTIKMGDTSDFSNFMGAVIDEKSFKNISNYFADAKNSPNAEILVGGKANSEIGYFVEPTVIEAKDPKYKSMCEEIFGPVLTVHVYDDNRYEEMLKVCDETSPYALTGAIFASDRKIISEATEKLVNAAGNFYINTKPTGAVVGQQPFGGARGSGTNDKAGSLFNLLRWVSLRTISETFVTPTDYRYPFLGAK